MRSKTQLHTSTSTAVVGLSIPELPVGSAGLIGEVNRVGGVIHGDVAQGVAVVTKVESARAGVCQDCPL